MSEFMLNVISALILFAFLFALYWIAKKILCFAGERFKRFFEKYQSTILTSMVASALYTLLLLWLQTKQ